MIMGRRHWGLGIGHWGKTESGTWRSEIGIRLLNSGMLGFGEVVGLRSALHECQTTNAKFLPLPIPSAQCLAPSAYSSHSVLLISTFL